MQSLLEQIRHLARDVPYTMRSLARQPALAVVAVLTAASALPARRATRVDPSEALPTE